MTFDKFFKTCLLLLGAAYLVFLVWSNSTPAYRYQFVGRIPGAYLFDRQSGLLYHVDGNDVHINQSKRVYNFISGTYKSQALHRQKRIP